jgi:L-rhamnono-1,4-lactonase
LLQHVKSEETLRQTLEKPSWRQNILRLGSGRGGKGWTFDVGIDTHSTGPWQIDVFADMIEKVRSSEDKNEGSGNRVRFILNHLCKPDLSAPSPSSFPAWRAAIQRMAGLPDVYMKFSGCLNEFYPSSTPSSVDGLLERLDGCARCVFEVFGQSRIMFGSDWPVCNIGGPLQENGNWELWRSVVETVVEKYCGEDVGEAKMDVFSRTGCRVYGVEV